MKQVIGILLVLVGIAYYAFQGFTYTSREKVLDVGPIEATSTSRNEIMPYSPILAGAIVIGGVALFISGLRRPVS
ncbi:MAG: hypothetical protein K0Q50_1175 [Vampirovibrio sp.]|jgi:uncharacterized membrane protein|nr:hypothetical protein [Vampirovibrio sp.]